MRTHILLFTLLSMIMWAGCSDDKENIIPADIVNIASSSTPGAIQLTWDLPEDYSTIKYVRVEYYDHYLKKNIIKLVSTYTTGLDVTNTRAEYGPYEFTLQVFSPTDTGGEIHKVTQVSEPVPTPPVTRYKVELTESNLYCCHLSTTEGDGDAIGNLLDGNTDTYFSTVNNLTMADPPHFLQVALPDDVTLTDFSFEYNTSNHAGGEPIEASVWVSAVGPKEDETDTSWLDDGNWTKIMDLTKDDAANSLPVGNAAKYTSDKLTSDTPFKYFRFRVETAINSSNQAQLRHFLLSEFSIYGYNQPDDSEAN